MEPTTDELLDQARRHRERREHNKAVSVLTSALVRLDSRSAQRVEALHMRGVSWEQLELFEQASNDYQAALKLAEQLNLPVEQGKIYVDFALLFLKTNDFGGAKMAAESAIELLKAQSAFPEMASALSAKGRCRYVEGNDAGAHELFARAEGLLVAYAPESPRRLYNIRLLIYLELCPADADWLRASEDAHRMASLARSIGDKRSLWLSRLFRLMIAFRLRSGLGKLESRVGLKRRP